MASDQPTAAINRWTNKIHQGDAFDALDELPAESVHAVVSDPPYGLAFMGRDWDDFQPKEYQEWCEEWAREAKRVLKPGAHLLAFSGNRTHHRLFSGIEDAGFEIRDTITWHYGSGFPKSLDVSKQMDKAANARWEDFKTALKPATEFVVVARKPLGEDTVAENVLEYGTGALNIGGCRVGIDPESGHWPGGEPEVKDEHLYSPGRKGGERNSEGRYPSNVVFDEQAADELDAKNDTTTSTGGVPDDGQSDERHEWGANVQASTGGLGDSGGVSRYFYTSKATKAERTLNGRIDNAHPTVKPLDLMEWLVALVTAEGQTVLDPFAGTGTTCKAAKDLGREFIGIEKQAKWADVARVRCGLDAEDVSHIRGDDAQAGLESFVATDGGEPSE